jgi:osmotically-inducible protein OsmY
MIARKKYSGNNKKERSKSTMKKLISCLALIVTVTAVIIINGSLSASVTDDRIEVSAKKSYVFKTYLKDDDIKIQSTDGVVVLTGIVAEESHKSLARETVASLPGVKSVDNKLAVKSEVPAENTDAWLITKVKTALLFHRNVSATGTEVLAKDGTVTLRGKADSAAQKNLTTEYAKDVEGVKVVKNEMTVSTAATKPGKKSVGKKVDAVTEAIDDASITALVKTTLLYHRSTSALNTTVETNVGVVKLGGKAKNAAEKDLATKLVSDVHGVKKVVNNMSTP